METHKPCCGELINCFPVTKVVFDRISQFTTLEACTTTIDDNDNIVEATSKVIMPVSDEL